MLYGDCVGRYYWNTCAYRDAIYIYIYIYMYMGGCQNYGPFLGALNIRCRIIIGIQKGSIILTTTHIHIHIYIYIYMTVYCRVWGLGLGIQGSCLQGLGIKGSGNRDLHG